MADGNSSNGGTQTAVNGKCPEGYVHVFGPLCVEQTTLSKFEEAVPDLPEFDFTNPGCEAALAALNDAIEAAEQALEMPRKLKAMAAELVEKPFDAAQSIVDRTLGVFDDINAAIDDLLSGPGSMVKDFRSSLESLLACPFIADTALGKTAAALLDELDSGVPSTQVLSDFKNRLSTAAGEYISQAKELPLSKLNDMEKLYSDMIERSGVGELLKKARDLEQCLRAACNMAEVAARVPKAVGTILDELGAKWDEASGKFTATLVKPVTESAKRAKQLADDLAVIQLAGSK